MSETEQKPQTEEQPQEGDAPAEATEDQPAKEEQTEGTGEVGADGEAAKEEGGAEQAASAEKEESKPAVAAQEASPPSLEAPQENPFSEDDLEQILQLEASEGEDKGWEKSKKIKGVTVFKKPEKNGVPLIKAYMEFSGIPCDKVLEFFTDAELRKKWSRKTPNYEILEERDDFKIVYTVIKMPMACDDRDIVQCMQVRSDEEQKRHVILYKSCNHPNKPPGKGPIRADVGIMGLVIRPKDGDETSTKVTWLSQIGLKGWALKMIVSRVTVGYPVSLCDDLQQYWKKTTAPKEPEKKEENETPKEEKTEENAEPKQEEGKTEEAAGDAPVENNVAAPVTADDEDIPAADEEEKGEEKAGEEA